MYKFSQRSLDNLEQCDPDLQVLCNHIIKMVDITVICGFRGEYEQNKAFAEGHSKLKWPNSRHNKFPSQAVDIAPYPIVWDDIDSFYDLRKLVLQEAAKLYKQGEMKRKIEVISWDLPHYQLKWK